MVVKKIISSPFVAIAVLVTLVAVIFRFSPKLLLSRQQRLFTAEELALHNGTDESIPILLGILGSVFDVTKGKSHYGVGGGYNHFAGRDASRAFVSGNFTGDGLTDSLRGLSSTEVKSIVEWREFYFRSYTCCLSLSSEGQCLVFTLPSPAVRFVGKLVGRYYNNQGNATKYLKGAEAKAARGAQLLEKQKAEEAKQPGCNSRWSQDEGGEVWCDTGFPRLVQRPLEIALTGKMSKRCACFLEDQLDQQGLEVYEGCDYLAQTCRV
ncbi:Membrane-associated progesterone-binding protein 4 [Citrus sinensis]|uniref:Membrane-associated progesterone-binding protein 4 n=1 Tax=Citrus sinensis TaxID=2711 RepID=A0ACB8P5X3_CITSI|nr:Membrane-associated progesterone-binding protein 4 [Citrus sinensis]